MGSFNRARVFDPLDLEIIDRVYEAAWAQLEAREPARDREVDGERHEALRKLVFACAIPGGVDFDKGAGEHADALDTYAERPRRVENDQLTCGGQKGL